MPLGPSVAELHAVIARNKAAPGEEQEEAEHLGPYGDLLCLAAAY